MAKFDSPGIVLSNASASSDTFALLGGKYAVSVVAAGIDFANYITLQMLGPDGSTYLDIKDNFDAEDYTVSRFQANGVKVFDLPAGRYRFTETGALTGIYAAITRAD